MERSEAHCVQVVGLRHHGPKTPRCRGVQAYNACSEVRGPEAHRESARSGDADNGEDAEVDSALPRRRYVVRDHGLLLGLGVVLLLGLGSVGLFCLGASLGLLLDLDLERAELVVPSKDVILPKRGRAEDFSLLWAAGSGRQRLRDGLSRI